MSPCYPHYTNAGDFYGVTTNYPATSGYDLASGLGSVNIANLGQ